MKAVALYPVSSTQALQLIEVPVPVQREPGQVLVKVLAVGLDGTDKELIHNRTFIPPVNREWLILGHELLGRVEEVEPGSRLQIGELVTALVRRPCFAEECIHCRSGRSDYCSTGLFTERGINSVDGFLTEYIVEEEQYLVSVPPSLIEAGVLIEPQSVIEKALESVQYVQSRLHWQPRKALILGAGPLGVLAALTCLTMGYEVDVYSREAPDRPAPMLLRNTGCAYHYGDSGNPTRTPGRKWDLIIECTGYSPLAFESITALSKNGILVILGVAAETGKVEISTDVLMRSLMVDNQSVIGSANASRQNFDSAIARLQAIKAQFPAILDQMITDRISLSQVPELDFTMIGLKAVVQI
ncbi:MAG: glucose dehydrogenase [Paenibacillus sp.]|nr:glucose dehydrogenase [Paenibacillus sp.]